MIFHGDCQNLADVESLVRYKIHRAEVSEQNDVDIIPFCFFAEQSVNSYVLFQDEDPRLRLQSCKTHHCYPTTRYGLTSRIGDAPINT